jgi:hypothetical protein
MKLFTKKRKAKPAYWVDLQPDPIAIAALYKTHEHEFKKLVKEGFDDQNKDYFVSRLFVSELMDIVKNAPGYTVKRKVIRNQDSVQVKNKKFWKSINDGSYTVNKFFQSYYFLFMISVLAVIVFSSKDPNFRLYTGIISTIIWLVFVINPFITLGTTRLASIRHPHIGKFEIFDINVKATATTPAYFTKAIKLTIKDNESFFEKDPNPEYYLYFEENGRILHPNFKLFGNTLTVFQ